MAETSGSTPQTSSAMGDDSHNVDNEMATAGSDDRGNKRKADCIDSDVANLQGELRAVARLGAVHETAYWKAECARLERVARALERRVDFYCDILEADSKLLKKFLELNFFSPKTTETISSTTMSLAAEFVDFMKNKNEDFTRSELAEEGRNMRRGI